MVIEMNKDIEKYQESVVWGLTVKQLLFSALSLLAGGGIVLLTYQTVGNPSSRADCAGRFL